MDEEVPGEDHSTPKGNSMTLTAGLKREVMGPPFFVFSFFLFILFLRLAKVNQTNCRGRLATHKL
jgi:hypothetical protein